tara:strand:- start:164 stop:436 length:273 start_codon:yes stop_codon:yes gene_type:complete
VEEYKAGNMYRVKDGYRHNFKKDTYFLLLCNVHHSNDWYVANYNMSEFDSFMAASEGILDGAYPKFPVLREKDVKDMGILIGNIKELVNG